MSDSRPKVIRNAVLRTMLSRHMASEGSFHYLGRMWIVERSGKQVNVYEPGYYVIAGRLIRENVGTVSLPPTVDQIKSACRSMVTQSVMDL